jgi:transcriptional regulator GlxA family with amidase domain
MPRTVHILLFDAVEVLDFAGPFEVFAAAGRDGAFTVRTVAESTNPIRATGGLTVTPDLALDDAPPAEVLVIPGGTGARTAMHQSAVLDWIRAAAPEAEVVLSVCTGALILARAGLLDGRTATTHHTALDALADLAPKTSVVADRRFVDNGSVVTAAGVAAGIDAALHIVRRLAGDAHAEDTARYMEYPHETERSTRDEDAGGSAKERG